jgi:sugar phosphate isomerase/epimerase
VLSLLATGAVVSFLPTGVAAARRWGVQLYTVRDLLKDRAAETLKAIAAIGYKELELGRADVDRLAPIAKDLGMTPVSAHIEAPIITGKWDAWSFIKEDMRAGLTIDRAVEQLAKHGLKYGVVSYLMPGERGSDASFYQRLAEQMNKAGDTARRAGITLGYHNHGFEFEKLSDGRTPLDVLVAEFDPKLVTLELDVFWVGITGADPVALLKKFSKRVTLVHLKDKARGAAAQTDESKVTRDTFKEVGAGALDFAAILKAAEAAGVQHYFVEQDHTPGDPLASLKQSYAYLEKLT